MKKAERQLESLLKNTPGLTHTKYCDHDDAGWVQTALSIQIGENSAAIGILNHTYWWELAAQLYDSKNIVARFPRKERKFVKETYAILFKGLKRLGYDIQELPLDELIGSNIKIW